MKQSSIFGLFWFLNIVVFFSFPFHYLLIMMTKIVVQLILTPSAYLSIRIIWTGFHKYLYAVRNFLNRHKIKRRGKKLNLLWYRILTITSHIRSVSVDGQEIEKKNDWKKIVHRPKCANWIICLDILNFVYLLEHWLANTGQFNNCTTT